MESVGKWSDLPPDILVEIAIKLKAFEDYIAFLGVCASWRAAAVFKGANIPLLILSNNYHRNCRFYSLSTNKICKAAVPEAEGKRCMDARFGWILAADPYGGEVCLFKPFSSSLTIPLPNIPEYQYTNIVKNALLTANPSQTPDFMVFALINRVLVFWKNGDKNWTRIGLGYPNFKFKSIAYCGHKMYAVDYDHRLWSWEPSATQCLTQLLTLGFLSSRDTPLMMESTAGELCVITRTIPSYQKGDSNFEVFRIDVVKREWEAMSGGMGNDVLFCSREDAAVSVSANDFAGLIMPNSIYFKKDGQFHMEIFSFEDKSTQRLNINSCRAVWVFP